MAGGPCYRLRRGPDWIEVWQEPCAETPQLKKRFCLGRLAGSRHELFAEMVGRWLRTAGAGRGDGALLSEDVASQIGLLCRCLGPMRSMSRMLQVAKGIDRMKPQETAYWLGLALYRYKRALPALRLLLTGCEYGEKTY